MYIDSALLAIGFFAAGYMLGRLDRIISIFKSQETDSFVSSIAREQKSNKKSVKIDESTYVTDVSISNLQSMGSSLGSVTQTKDDISTATNKLAQLKKLKG